MLKLTFKTHPFSINKAHYRRGNRTKEYREWAQHIHDSLDQYEEEISSFREEFNPLKHGLEIHILHEIPENILYTKAGKISRRSKDLTNIEKTLVDTLYDARFFKRGFSVLNLDDTLNITMHSYKRCSPVGEFHITFIVQIVPLEESRSIPSIFL